MKTNKTQWIIDRSHSEIAFRVRHLMIAFVKGSFKIFDANIFTTDKDFATATINLWIDVASITTGDDKRDEHLKSSDFFDVANHKQIKFTSTSIKQLENKNNYELRGMLYIRDFPQEVLLNVQYRGIVKDPMGNEKAGFTVTGSINKIAWGLSWNRPMPSGGLMLSEEVLISCEVELTNAGQKDLEMEKESVVNKTAL